MSQVRSVAASVRSGEQRRISLTHKHVEISSMNLFAKNLLSIALAGVSVAAVAEDWTGSANVAFTSDYMFRGISQTDDMPAVQGGFDVNHASGFYIGTWASNVQFHTGESAEFDLYGGYANSFSNGLGYNLGVLGYFYPGADDAGAEHDYQEYKAGLSYTFEDVSMSPALGATVYYSPEYWGEIGNATYYDLSLGLTLMDNLGMKLHWGLQDLDEDQAGVDSYQDWKVGFNTTLAGVGFDLSYVGVDDDGETFGTSDLTDDRFVLTASKSF